MRTYFYFLFLLFSIYSFGQNVTFTDINFKNKLLSSSPSNQVAKNLNGVWFEIDQNNDGNISFSEAANVSYIDVKNSNISSINGINRFYNIKTLICSDNNIQNLDLVENGSHELSYLEFLDCSNNNISLVNYSGGNNLAHFNASFNELDYDSFLGEELPICEYLDIRNNSFTELKIDTYRSGIVLYENNPIKKLNYPNWYESDLEIIQIPTLEELSVQSMYHEQSNFNNLKVHNQPTLKKVYISTSITDSFDVELNNNPILDDIYVNNEGEVIIESLGISEFEQLIIYSKSLIIRNLPNLEHLILDDIGDFQSTVDMTFENLPTIHTLKIKRPLESLNIGTLPQLRNLKIDRIVPDMSTGPYPLQLDITSAKFPNLEDLELIHLYLYTDLSIKDFPYLKSFKSHFNDINHLTIHNNPNLEILQSFNVLYTNLQEDGRMILENFPKLKDAKLYSFNENGNTVKEIYFRNLPLLEELYFSIDSDDYTTAGEQFIDVLDLSTCPSLNDLTLWFNLDGEIDFLNLRNGNNTYTQLRMDENINQICVDDETEKQQIISEIGEGAQFTFDCNLNLNEINTNLELTIYPNPATNTVKINSKEIVLNVEIFDTTGQLIQSIPVKNSSISTKGLKKGTYILKLNFSNRTSVTKKLIKI